MPASFKVEVNPAVLVWARRSSGFRPDEIAKKLAIDEQRLLAWEAGDEQPTLVQLRKLGGVYRRPLAVFLLDEPPKDGKALKDFRGASVYGRMSPGLRFAMRDAKERRDVALELRDSFSDSLQSFDITARIDEDPENVAVRIRKTLGVSIDEQKEFGNTALSRWRAAIETRGVLVFGFTGVEVHEARGFSLSDQPYPVIGINNKDAPNGRVFTLTHELTHIALRSGEVLCDFSDQGAANVEVETFCNHVAGSVLVPRAALLEEQEVKTATPQTEWNKAAIDRLARRYQVSREVVLRRLLILKRTNSEHYAQWRKIFVEDYQKYKTTLKDSQGGPKYSTKMVSQLGRLYSRMVLAAHSNESITTSAASAYLGVKVKQFDSLAAELAMGGA